MRLWARAPIDSVCGRCGAPIATGDPVRVLRLPGMRRALLRCAACAAATDGDAPPADLPPLAGREPPAPLPFVPRAPGWAHVVTPKARAWADHRRAAAQDADEEAS